MKHLKETILDQRAIQYIQICLARGLTLSRNILARGFLVEGRASVLLPEDANSDVVYRFESGGILPPSPESTWHRFSTPEGRSYVMKPVPVFETYLIESIQSFLEADTGRVYVFENALARPSDPATQRYRSDVHFFNDEVYHVLMGGQRSCDEVELTIRESTTSLNYVGVMTSLTPEARNLLVDKTVSADTMKVLAERTERIIVGAYDGEGSIVWSRADHHEP